MPSPSSWTPALLSGFGDPPPPFPFSSDEDEDEGGEERVVELREEQVVRGERNRDVEGGEMGVMGSR